MGVNNSYCVGVRKRLIQPAYAGGSSALINCSSSDTTTDISTKSLRKRFGEYKQSTGKKCKTNADTNIENSNDKKNERIIKIQFEDNLTKSSTNKMKERMVAVRERIQLAKELGRDPKPLMIELDNMLSKLVKSYSSEDEDHDEIYEDN